MQEKRGTSKGKEGHRLRSGKEEKSQEAYGAKWRADSKTVLAPGKEKIKRPRKKGGQSKRKGGGKDTANVWEGER